MIAPVLVAALALGGCASEVSGDEDVDSSEAELGQKLSPAELAKTKAALRKLSNDNMRRSDNFAQVRTQADPLVAKLAGHFGTRTAKQKLPLVTGAWRQLWSDYPYPMNGFNKMDPAQVYQVVTPDGYYYNIGDSTSFFVFGTTGNVGYGAALGLLAAGATVIAPTRTPQGADGIRAAFAGRALHAVVGDVSEPDDALRLRDTIAREYGGIDHVFVALGPWWQGGALADQAATEWSRVRAMLLDGHVHAATVFLPLLAKRPGSSYTLATGMGAHRFAPGTSLLHIATHGALALSRVIREEHRAGPTRVNEILIACRIERVARPGVVPSAVFGEAVAAIANHSVRSEVLRYDAPDRFRLP
jgi:NAD(P)-dependent dehydrogenase (short-subunit alcohol dehydrogenase family)